MTIILLRWPHWQVPLYVCITTLATEIETVIDAIANELEMLFTVLTRVLYSAKTLGTHFISPQVLAIARNLTINVV